MKQIEMTIVHKLADDLVVEVEISDEPHWLTPATLQTIMSIIKKSPTFWLTLGVQWIYMDIRLDVRTGHVLIKSDSSMGDILFIKNVKVRPHEPQ